MTTGSIIFKCPGCTARIKAPYGLMGHKRVCPGCAGEFVVPFYIPEDSGPMLVPLVDEYRFSHPAGYVHAKYVRKHRPLVAEAC